MSRYRKIEVKTWSDEKFRSLSKIPACGQGLWFFLLTGPHTGPIPGLFRAGRAGMAEELNWDTEAFDKAFQEVFDKGMAKADFAAKLVWLPKAVIHNKPESPNVVKSWRTEIDLLPECDLKDEALTFIRNHLKTLGEAYLMAFDGFCKTPEKLIDKPYDKPLSKPSDKPICKTMANQEQEQEQEQEREQRTVQPIVDNSTSAGSACQQLKKLGITSVNPHHPELQKLLASGVTVDAIVSVGREPKAKGKPLAWVLAAIQGRIKDAASAELPQKASAEKQWFESASGIEDRGRQLGVTMKPGEQFGDFKARVFDAAKLSTSTVRKARIDAGVRP